MICQHEIDEDKQHCFDCAAIRFTKKVEAAVNDPLTAEGVKGTYQELLKQLTAALSGVAELRVETKRLTVYNATRTAELAAATERIVAVEVENERLTTQLKVAQNLYVESNRQYLALKQQIESAKPAGITDDNGRAWAYNHAEGNFPPNTKLFYAPQPVNAELLTALIACRRALGDHNSPNDCYATGPLTGYEVLDLVQCPACVAIPMADAAILKAEQSKE